MGSDYISPEEIEALRRRAAAGRRNKALMVRAADHLRDRAAVVHTVGRLFAVLVAALQMPFQ